MDWIKKNWFFLTLSVVALLVYLYYEKKRKEKIKKLKEDFKKVKAHILKEAKRYEKDIVEDKKPFDDSYNWGRKLWFKAFNKNMSLEDVAYNDAIWVLINASEYDYDEDFVKKHIKRK